MDQSLKQDLTANLRPISEFIELGLLYMINRDYMMPKGYVIALYLDDEDGQSALGWGCISLEEAEKIGLLPDQAMIDEREDGFKLFEC